MIELIDPHRPWTDLFGAIHRPPLADPPSRRRSFDRRWCSCGRKSLPTNISHFCGRCFRRFRKDFV